MNDDRVALTRAAAAQQIAHLAAQFRRTAIARVELLQCAIAALRQEPESLPLRQEARRLAHSLRGTAGSYGLTALGKAAGGVEDTLLESTRVDWPTLDASLDALQKLAARDVDDEMARPAAAAPGVVRPLRADHGRVRRCALLIGTRESPFFQEVQRAAANLMIDVDVVSDFEAAAAMDAGRSVDFFVVDAEAVGGSSAVLRASAWLDGRPLIVGSRDASMQARVAAVVAGASTVLHLPAPSSLVTEALHLALAPSPSRRQRVLVLDDDPNFCGVVAALLAGEPVDVQHMCFPEDLAAVLDAPPPDLLLLDVVMPDASGLDVCRALRATAGWRDVPVFFVSADTRSETRIASFRVGGDDFIAKAAFGEELRVKLRVGLERVRVRRDLTDRDALTGLLLRRPLIEQLNQRVAMARRRGQPLAIAMLDLDHFKRINDERGHQAGDRVLATVGQLVRDRFRIEDVSGRWGGEELVLGLTSGAAAEGARVIARILDELGAMSFEADDGTPFHVSFSAGVASFPDDGDALDQLLKVADRRLYAAKAAGRRCVVERG